MHARAARFVDLDLARRSVWNAWLLQLCSSQGPNRPRFALDHRSMGKPRQAQCVAITSVGPSSDHESKANHRWLRRALRNTTSWWPRSRCHQECGLTLPSSGPSPAGFTSLRGPLKSNVRHHAQQNQNQKRHFCAVCGTTLFWFVSRTRAPKKRRKPGFRFLTIGRCTNSERGA